MKNQLDLIVTIVSVVLAAIIVLIWMETKRVVVKPTPPDQPALGVLAYPAVNVQMATGLPAGGGGGGAGMGRMGGRPGMGGMAGGIVGPRGGGMGSAGMPGSRAPGGPSGPARGVAE